MDPEMRWKHAWNYFNIHASQRMSVFNFYLVLVGLLTAGLVKTFDTGFPYPRLGCALGVVLILVSLVFWRLDQRTSFLVKLSESALITLEGQFDATNPRTGTDFREVRIFAEEKRTTDQTRRWYLLTTYGLCFKMMFTIFAALGLVGAVLAAANQVH